jgi:hypothetical protein
VSYPLATGRADSALVITAWSTQVEPCCRRVPGVCHGVVVVRFCTSRLEARARGSGALVAPRSGLRRVVRGGALGGVDQLSGHHPEFDVAPL